MVHGMFSNKVVNKFFRELEMPNIEADSDLEDEIIDKEIRGRYSMLKENIDEEDDMEDAVIYVKSLYSKVDEQIKRSIQVETAADYALKLVMFASDPSNSNSKFQYNSNILSFRTFNLIMSCTYLYRGEYIEKGLKPHGYGTRIDREGNIY